MKKSKRDQQSLLVLYIDLPTLYILYEPMRYEMKTLTAVYYFRVCAKVWRGPKLKVALIMNYVAGEETVCVQTQG